MRHGISRDNGPHDGLSSDRRWRRPISQQIHTLALQDLGQQPWRGQGCQVAPEEHRWESSEAQELRSPGSSESGAPRRLRSNHCSLLLRSGEALVNALNTEDTNDPDTQLSETEAAWETMPHSNLHAARVLLISHSLIGAQKTTLLPVRLILKSKKQYRGRFNHSHNEHQGLGLKKWSWIE